MGVLGVYTVLAALFGLSWTYMGWWGVLALGVAFTGLGILMDLQKSE